jgi:DNA-binding transcriptional LysR family regulator
MDCINIVLLLIRYTTDAIHPAPAGNFIAVARHESVSRAADALALSQSATSTALGELERQFDTQLFDRIGKALRLNEAGHVLLPHAVQLIEHAREIESMLARQTDFGPLQIGATLTVGNYLATLIAADFLRRHPSARVGCRCITRPPSCTSCSTMNSTWA